MMSGLGIIGMSILLLGTVLLALLVWMLDETARREERPVLVKVSTVEDALRGRLVRGEISAREFEDTLRQLRDS